MEGIRVIDMTSVLSGPFCTWLLASLGADVIKVEHPDGDTARSTPPFERGVSLYFASVNRNKRSLELNIKDADDSALLLRLLATADVFITNNPRMASLERAGIDPETVRDNSTMQDGGLPSTGIPFVLVNGTVVVRDSKTVDGVFPGKPIKGAGTVA